MRGYKIGKTDRPVIFHRGTKGLFRKREVLYYKCRSGWIDSVLYGGHETGICRARGTEGEMLEHLVLFHKTPMEEAEKYLRELRMSDKLAGGGRETFEVRLDEQLHDLVMYSGVMLPKHVKADSQCKKFKRFLYAEIRRIGEEVIGETELTPGIYRNAYKEETCEHCAGNPRECNCYPVCESRNILREEQRKRLYRIKGAKE